MNKVEINQAKILLLSHEVVAIPTETVYGLAARIDSEAGLKKIFSTKERPFFDPLIVHVSSIEMAKTLTTHWNEMASQLAKAFWPGPLTIILPKSDIINPIITSGLEFVGIRMPRHKMTLELIEKLGTPLAAPSANKFKKTSPTKASHVYDEFRDEVAIIDGGDCQVGIESTVLQIFENEIVIYRPGDITAQMIEEVLKDPSIKIHYGKSPVAPGQLEEHYRPKAPVVLIDETTDLATLSMRLKEKEIPTTNALQWKLPDDASIVAREIYAKMREFSDQQASVIIFEMDSRFYQDEKWFGIINRLTKASSLNLSTL